MHEVQRSLQVPFHGAASMKKKNSQRKSAQVCPMRSGLVLRLKSFPERSTFDTWLRVSPADVVRTWGLARGELKRKQAKPGQENKMSGVQ